MTASSARVPARRWQVLDGTALKLLAMALMTADHIHQMFAPAGAPLWLTILGRPVFPLFLFAAAEGFHYTRSRRRYLLRLLLASWGMTLLTTALQQAVPEPGVVLMNNAFSTFFVTGVYIQSWGLADRRLAARRSGLVRRPGLVLRGLLAALLPLAGMLPALAAGALSFREDVPLAVLRGLAFLSLLLPQPAADRGRPGPGGAGGAVLHLPQKPGGPGGGAGGAGGPGMAAAPRRHPVLDGRCGAAHAALQRQAGPRLETAVLPVLPRPHRGALPGRRPALKRRGTFSQKSA